MNWPRVHVAILAVSGLVVWWACPKVPWGDATVPNSDAGYIVAMVFAGLAFIATLSAGGACIYFDGAKEYFFDDMLGAEKRRKKRQKKEKQLQIDNRNRQYEEAKLKELASELDLPWYDETFEQGWERKLRQEGMR